MRPGLQGVVLDSALLLKDGICMDPGIEILLERLSYCNLRQGLLIKENFASHKDVIVEHVSFAHMLVKVSSATDGLSACLKDFTSEWAVSADCCLFLTDSLIGELKDQLLKDGWHISVTAEFTGTDELANQLLSVKGLFYQIASINRALRQGLICVGYTMKWSREKHMLKHGALPIHPTNENLMFFPLQFDIPLAQQLAIIDMVLYKPADEIAEIAIGEADDLQQRIKFTHAMEELIRYLKMHPHICVIDPIEKIFPLFDRLKTLEILQSLPNYSMLQSRRIRPPHFVKVSNFDSVDLSQILKAYNITLPAIVKPQIACGVPDAHRMAIVFKINGFTDLEVPYPAIIQEYVDHGSKIYKFYVIGTKILYSVRRSTPDAASLGNLNVPPAILFDSLKSLPASFLINDDNEASTCLSHEKSNLDLDLVHAATDWLRRKLEITVFGFDVLVQSGTQDHVIVDVNFLPTFKDVAKEESIPALWEALYKAYKLHRQA